MGYYARYTVTAYIDALRQPIERRQTQAPLTHPLRQLRTLTTNISTQLIYSSQGVQITVLGSKKTSESHRSDSDVRRQPFSLANSPVQSKKYVNAPDAFETYSNSEES
jgi:hypothetical protein